MTEHPIDTDALAEQVRSAQPERPRKGKKRKKLAAESMAALNDESLAAVNESRAKVGMTLGLIGGVTMVISGMMTLSGAGTWWIPFCAVALAIAGMVLRKPRSSAS